MIQSWQQSLITTPPPAAPSAPLAKYVAVGASGTVLTSVDGQTWTSRVSGFTTNSISSIAWSPTAKIFVIAGVNGLAARSTDGVNWTTFQLASSSLACGGVEWTMDLFWVATTGSVMYTSPDGINWTERTQPASPTLTVSSSSTPKVFAAAGLSNQRGAVFAPSPTEAVGAEMGFGGSFFGQWAVGNLNGLWVGGGQAFKISTSPADVTTGMPGAWTLRKSSDTVSNTSCVRNFHYDPYRARYVAVGGGGASGVAGPGIIALSTNGTTWPGAGTRWTSVGNSNYFMCAASDPSYGYIGAADGIYRTTDWTTAPMTKVATSAVINRIIIRTDI